MDVQKEYFNSKSHEMIEEVHALISKYDSKVLAIVLLTQAAGLLRVCNAVGFMTADETTETIEEAMRDVLVPMTLDQIPQVQTIGQPRRLS